METKSPYEEYLKQTLVEERAHLDSLYNEFAKSNPIRKQMLKTQITEAIQNIDLLSKDLEKYMNGLSWLREPSKERDEKAEHLPKLEKEEAAPAPQAKPAAPGQVAKPAVARPTIGKPIGASSPATLAPVAPAAAPRPTVGTPVGTRPKIGTPVGTKPSTPVAQTQAPAQETQPSTTRPTIGTPVKRPVIGTPIGKPKPQNQDNNDQTQASTESSSS
jgi:hypothetical protein